MTIAIDTKLSGIGSSNLGSNAQRLSGLLQSLTVSNQGLQGGISEDSKFSAILSNLQNINSTSNSTRAFPVPAATILARTAVNNQTQTQSKQPYSTESLALKLDELLSTKRSDKPTTEPSIVDDLTNLISATADFNKRLVSETQAAISKGVKYAYGAKNSSSGAVDCSGWVAEMNKGVANSLGTPAELKDAMSALRKGAAYGGAAGIIREVGASTGTELSGARLTKDTLKEGMLIGVDASSSQGNGRYKGIDHISQVVKDPSTGNLMVSESRGGKGVVLTALDSWWSKNEAKPKYAVDLYAAVRGTEKNTMTAIA